MDLDDSVVGLKKENMQKVSSFRTQINVRLIESGRSQSLPINEAVKYLRATKFDIPKAEELYWNYQHNVSHYNLQQLKSQGQLLNAEIRTRKLEVLGTRDSNGSLLLVYTASRHTPKSHDSYSAIQLFFLILSQISDSNENQSRGVTFIFDMRDTQPSSFNGSYADTIFNILLNGYPIFVSMIYIVDVPQWFIKDQTKRQAYTTLHKLGKVQLCSASGLLAHLPAASVPQSFGGSFVTGMASFVPSTEALTHSLSPTHSPAHSVTPPPRKNKPIIRQSSDTDDSAESQPIQGSVNKMKELLTTSIEGQVQNNKLPSSSKPLPGVVGRQKSPKLNGNNATSHSKNPKPLPPPKLNHSISSEPPSTRVKPKIPLLPTKKREGRNPGIVKAFSSDDGIKDKEDSKPALIKQSPLLGRSGNGGGKTTTTNTTTPHDVSKDNNDAKKATKHLVSINLKGSSNQSDKVSTPPPSYDPPPFPDSDNHKPHSQTKLKKTQVSTPPPSYMPPSPPTADSSDSKPNAKPRYVNVNVTKLVEGASSNTKEQPQQQPQQQQHHKAAPYKVTTISDPPSVAAPSPPPSTSVKLREPITHIPELPKKETEPKKSKPNCYENVFFTRETLHEDEGSCFDGAGTGDDEAIYENFGPDEGNRWMTVDELEQYVARKGKQGLSAEYYKIKNDPLYGSADVFRLPCNTSKNRYKDVVCYDSSRVILNKINDMEGSDYIHANYVNGFEKKQAYILTQGPLKRTTADYWRMLWEKEVFVVVMTTKCVEMAKLKCAQYWPDEGKASATFDNITVSVTEHELKGSFEFRKLSVQCDGQTRVLMHYQFIAWPDYGVPETGKQIFDLLDEARRTQEQFSEYVDDPLKFPLYGPPLVIHCSAGIGRSGTFMALDYSIDELRVKGRVNLQHCVRLLRQQRAFAIQTDEQYRFCYTTLLEYGKYLKQVLKL